MIFGATEITLCIVPVFTIIAAIGIWLFIRKGDDSD